MALSKARKRELLRQMYTIRAFEEQAEQLYALGKVHGIMHLSIGMEASAVGAIAALRPDDLILSNHRGHGYCIAKGADLNRMVAELMGKEAGYCRGRGGSMHIADVESGNLDANGVVGGSFSVKKAFAIERISDRAAAYGMPGTTVDGNDLLAVYQAVSQAVKRARAGGGPSLIENVTYRWRGHSKSDANRYRTREEIETWKQKCPIKRFRAHLIKEGVLTEAEASQIEQEAYAAIDAAVAFAEASPARRKWK